MRSNRTLVEKVVTLAVAAFTALSLANPAPASARTEREVYQKRVSRVAPPLGKTGRVACVCRSSSPLVNGMVGYVFQFAYGEQVKAQCYSDQFNTAGSKQGSTICADFITLGK